MGDCRLVREAKSLGFELRQFHLQVFLMKPAAVPGCRMSTLHVYCTEGHT